ncbi:MAG: cadmium-translocating P-type ATPase [Methanosphaera stadtmanae]|nr:cadmium-translocating P-type ATPase [Methanosphaera stadtmanae]
MAKTPLENHCYDPDCVEEECFNPKHFNFICLNPNCNEKHCEINTHYNKKLLEDFQHQSFINNDNVTEIHEHHHHKDDCCSNDDCCCDDDDCCCDDDVEVKLCNCDDCCDDDDDEEVIKEGIPLIQNKSIQIIVGSAILFVIGYLLENVFRVESIYPTAVFLIGTVLAGYDIVLGGIKAIIYKHKVTTSFLIGLAAIASFLIGHPEEAAAVTFLYFLSEFLEDYAEQRAQHSIKSLVEIAPDTAIVKKDGAELTLNIEEVHINDIVIVKPGDKIPLDGVCIKGNSSVNQASITGESIPVNKNIGDEVFAGTVNEDGYLEIKVTKESKDTVISKIVNLVKKAQLNKSDTETFVDKFSSYYTPLIITGAVLVAIIPPLFFAQNAVDWIYKALTIMVVSCPCAFVISTPIAMVSSITSASRQGVLIKGSSYVEEMRNIKTVIFDKTGTLTEGKLKVVDINIINENYSENEVVTIAASLEDKSSHPIGLAITNYANDNNIPIKEIDNFKNVSGKGIVGFIDGTEYYAANESLIEGSNFEVSYDIVEKYASNGKTVVFIGNKDSVIAIITVIDKIRDETKEVIQKLHNKNVQTIMLTGDNKIAAHAVGQEIGIDYVYSDLLPGDKLDVLDTIRNKFGDVAMVGDGVNDAPALARANIGIAMGAVGSDVAIETADVALMQDDLTKLPYLFDLSYKTMSVIKENVITAATVKSVFAILAILGMITLMEAVGFGDMGLTLLVILNSLRIGMVKSTI